MKIEGVFNRDMRPSQHLIGAFPQLEPVLHNPPITRAFMAHEREAVRWKRVHGLLGRTALWCLFLGMGFFDYQLTLGQHYPVPEFVPMAAAGLTGIGVVCQLAMLLGKTKEHWLVERFAAERLRCLKFQTFALVVQSADAAELAARVSAFTREALARLDQELMGGRAAVLGYSPSDLALPSLASAGRLNDSLLEDGFKAYTSTRIEVQAQHFDAQSARSDRRARFWTLLSETTFALGGAIAFVQICYAISLGSISASGTNGFNLWLAFSALLLFILSAILAVYQRGSAQTPDAERYKHYAHELRWLKRRSEPKTAEEFARLVEHTEALETRELFDFCRDAAHSSYIF